MASIQQQTHLRNGLPAGGATGQIPIKQSDNDFDVVWEDPAESGTTNTFGSGLTVNGTQVSLAIASDSSIGGIRIGTGLSIVDGVASVDIEEIVAQAADADHTHNQYASISHTHTIADVTNLATTLTGKADTGHLHELSDISGLSSALNAKADTSHSHTASSISGLSAVATTGNYADLTNKPSIPAAYTLPTATGSVLGGIKVGTNLSISNGVLSATDTTYGSATTSVAGLMSASDKSKLNGIAANANNYTLPTATTSTLGGVKVDGVTIAVNNGIISALNSGGEAVTYNAGTGITITGATIAVTADAYAAYTHTHTYQQVSGLATVANTGSYNDLSNKPTIPGAYSLPTATGSVLGGIKVGTNLSISSGVLSATNTTYNVVTTTVDGLMSAADKVKLNGVATNANNYSLPTATSSVLGGIKVGTNLTISSGVLSATDTTYSPATTSVNGLLSATDKSKLDGIANNANNYSLPAATTSTLGGVKVDGSTITIRDGIISSVSNESSGGVNWVNVPTDAAAPGTAGDIAFDTNYMYICIFENTWRRIAHNTWGGSVAYAVTGTTLNGVPGDSVTGTTLTLGGTGSVTGTILTLE